MRREHFGHAWLGMILLFCDLLKLINHLNKLMPAYLKIKLGNRITTKLEHSQWVLKWSLNSFV